VLSLVRVLQRSRGDLSTPRLCREVSWPVSMLTKTVGGMKEMIHKKVLNAQRVRRISGSFAFLEHRFLRNGFLSSLSHGELILYVFLVLAADRVGLSYYSHDRICEVLKIDLKDYLTARDGLLDKDLIAFDGVIFQVLSLPVEPPAVWRLPDQRPRGQVQIGQRG